jgi:maleylpyruvate isomerase
MDEGTRLFDTQVRRLGNNDLGEPASLPRWTRAHVIAHVTRNADALGNLLNWARTGIETPMYESDQQRDADIEDTATQSPEVLRFDLDDAERRFAVAVASLPPDTWSAEVRTRAGRTIQAVEVPWMRCREVWVHAVDLGTGVAFADFPAGFVDAFLADVAAHFTARPDCGAVDLVATDTQRRWPIGPHSANEVVVQGAAHDLLAWLIGRQAGGKLIASGRGSLPTIPGWLDLT